MSESIPALEISATKASLPTCSPNLMPFHIAYTGPAPISTYFRVKQVHSLGNLGYSATDASTATCSRTDTPSVSESQQTLVASSSTAGSSLSSETDIPAATLELDVEMGSPDEVENSGSRDLTAAFRGRVVRGITVALPEGYAGLVFSTPETTEEKRRSSSDNIAEEGEKGRSKKAPASKRGTRRSAKAAETTEIDEQDVMVAGLAEVLEESGPIRILKPTSTFPSFVMWNADIPVDQGKDEYLRTLTEWMKLSAAINHYED